MAAHQAPHPWDSPGKNTGVGCHFLLQCMKVKSQSEVVQSCSTLSDLMDCSLPGSSIHGIFQARVLQWGAFAFPESVSSIYIYNHTKIHLYMYNKPRQIEARARENTRRLDTMSFSLLFFYSDMRYTFFKKHLKS